MTRHRRIEAKNSILIYVHALRRRLSSFDNAGKIASEQREDTMRGVVSSPISPATTFFSLPTEVLRLIVGSVVRTTTATVLAEMIEDATALLYGDDSLDGDDPLTNSAEDSVFDEIHPFHRSVVIVVARTLGRFGGTCRFAQNLVDFDSFWCKSARAMVRIYDVARLKTPGAHNVWSWYTKSMRETIVRGPTLIDESTKGRWYRCATAVAFSNHGNVRLPRFKPAAELSLLQSLVVLSHGDGDDNIHVKSLFRCLNERQFPPNYTLRALPNAWSLQKMSRVVRYRRRLEYRKRALLDAMLELEPPTATRTKTATAHLKLGAPSTDAVLIGRMVVDFNPSSGDKRPRSEVDVAANRFKRPKTTIDRRR